MEAKVYIDANFDRFVQQLRSWCRQPSLSTANQGMLEMANLVQDTMREAGLAPRLISIPGGYPVVYAECQGTSEKTLLFYNHYDVQPVGSLDTWQTDPFAAEIYDDCIIARGIADDKACLLSRIQAVEAILKTQGTLPVGIKFLVEGEEEIGSPHLRSFVEASKDLLKADWCVWEYAAKNELDNPTVTLGNKGMCYIELTAQGPKEEWHSMYAPIIPNPAWRLAWALASLKNEREEILIDGFLDDVEPLSDEELAVLAKIPTDEQKLKEAAGLPNLLQDVNGIELKKHLYGAPTCTICGVTSGYQGSGMKTIVPATATAKVDFRLVPHQQPTDIFTKVRRHLSEHGFQDVRVETLASASPSKTPVTDPLVAAIERAAKRAYERDIVILPTSPGTSPRDVFSTWTRMPIAGLGVGHIGSAIHGPNENVRSKDYLEGIQHIAALLEELGKV